MIKDSATIIYIALAVGGTVGGILTAINKMRFVKKADCDKQHSGLCDKFDDLKKEIKTNAKESQERRETDKKELNEHLINIAEFVGSVKQYMEQEK